MILKIRKEDDYELIDSGEEEKLERYGSYVLRRPDPEALWSKSKDILWNNPDLKFIREKEKTKWIINNNVPKSWNIKYDDLTFSIKPTSFKHIGIFPEQISNWDWIEELINKSIKNKQEINVLNLFAYTGGASLICARAGARVCHVDSSKMAVSWARENAKLSNLEDKPIRWIVDDIITFLKREIRRGSKYDAIIMDPPSFGHGPAKELWKIEENFKELIESCRKVLSNKPLFILINGYTAGYSSITYQNILSDMMKEYNGVIESGELVIGEKDDNRLLPCGIFARWSDK